MKTFIFFALTSCLTLASCARSPAPQTHASCGCGCASGCECGATCCSEHNATRR
ncbi:MAG: hypothetical protein HY861_01425 [Chlamydiia bacterium]|nr:hypothetical protein [Chlamydiia bacterium]